MEELIEGEMTLCNQSRATKPHNQAAGIPCQQCRGKGVFPYTSREINCEY